MSAQNPAELAKTFEPAGLEAKWYAHWESKGLFRPERPDAAPFTIVNPPPNVTGSLHIGHALDNTLQDVMIRYERLRGKDALWVVGTDHAGIATQMVVERQMEAQGDKRTNYTREQFIDKVWEWKHESGGTITDQLRRLGCSMDWSREQFTMDPHFTRAVVKVFVDLHNQGLIYRDKRLVNWGPKLKTAISDLEVETRETQGGFWHFKYPLADGVTRDDGLDYIEVATTRPETMLADMIVAVHPEDPRYQHLHGKFLQHPFLPRRIPIITDSELVDMNFGTGAVKVTPAHDPNDYLCGKRNNLEFMTILTDDGRIAANGGQFAGMMRYDARVEMEKALDELGLFRGKEVNKMRLGICSRSGDIVEPMLTPQWYVNCTSMAKRSVDAVRNGDLKIVPAVHEATWYNWLDNIR